jgi:glycosyltransferase involved in cell wall biosynthesis
MKIAHFVQVAPKRSGLYETTRDLCLAECELGYEAKLVDTSWVENEQKPPTSFKMDRGLDVATMDWARDADVFVLHSLLPKELWGTKPTVLVLHGAPEYVFYSQVFGHKDGDGGHSTLIMYSTQDWIKKCVTFWPRHVPYWQTIYGDAKVALCPTPVKMDEYTPDGTKHVFKIPGLPNVGFCDTWRPTFFKDPFQIVAGFRQFWKKSPEARLQMFGIPSDDHRMGEWGGVWDKHLLAVKRSGDFLGEIYEMHDKMDEVYRALDIVITSTVDASRIVRECLSCGTALVAPYGNEYTDFVCDISNPDSVAEILGEAWNAVRGDRDTAQGNCLMRAKQFNSIEAAKEFVKVLESVV